MARTVQVHLVDDLDGSRAEETVKFSLDGIEYDIDLNEVHADDLRRIVAPFIVAGRRTVLGRGIVTGRRPGGAATAGVGARDRNRNRAIRAWAEQAGIPISGRGRIPSDVVERFEKDAGR